MKSLLLFFITLNAYTLTIFDCGIYQTTGVLSENQNTHTLTIDKGTMSEQEFKVEISDSAAKIIKELKYPIRSSFTLEVSKFKNDNYLYKVLNLNFVPDPTTRIFKKLHTKKCP